MKKLLVLVVLLSLLLTACGPSDATCQLNWDSMDVEPGDEGMTTSMILNREHLPGTVGEILQKCLRRGWDGWR